VTQIEQEISAVVQAAINLFAELTLSMDIATRQFLQLNLLRTISLTLSYIK